MLWPPGPAYSAVATARSVPATGIGPAGAHQPNERVFAMLKWALIFAVISLVAGVLGFGGVAAGAAGIAKVLFFVFVLIFVVLLVLALLGIGAIRNARHALHPWGARPLRWGWS
eukprot:gene48979-65667_t